MSSYCAQQYPGSLLNHFYPELDNVTRTQTQQDYLAECRQRDRDGLRPLQPYSISQWVPAFKAGLYPHRPAAGEPGAEFFDRLEPEPLSRTAQERILITLRDDPLFNKAMQAVLNQKGNR